MKTKAKVLKINPSDKWVKETIQDIAMKSSERVYFTNHATERMQERDITNIQVIRCLRHGKVIEGPSVNMKGNWKLTMEIISSGDLIRVVSELDRNKEGDYVVIITAY